jgi:hypothetical protein
LLVACSYVALGIKEEEGEKKREGECGLERIFVVDSGLLESRRGWP